jgi:hypothetical protein
VVIGGYKALADRSDARLHVHHFGGEQTVEHAIRFACRRMKVESHEHPVDDSLGPGAPSVRNLQLLDDLLNGQAPEADSWLAAVIGFRSEGKSNEMDDMLALAYERHVPTYEIMGRE